MKKTLFEYQLYFLLMLIATVLSAFIIPNPWLRVTGVTFFAILCHLFGVKEGELMAKAAAKAVAENDAKRAAEAAVQQANEAAENSTPLNKDPDEANDDTFALKP